MAPKVTNGTSQEGTDVPRELVAIEVFYPGYFLPTFGIMVFDVWFDEKEVIRNSRYLKGFREQVVATPGPHKLEIRSRNIVSRIRNTVPFFVEIPEKNACQIRLVYDQWLLNGWKTPIVGPCIE